MKKLMCFWRVGSVLDLWGVGGGLCLLFAFLCLGGDEWRMALRYERQSIAAGQWWRLLTGHFVHLSWAHAFLNGFGVLVCMQLFSQPIAVGRGCLDAFKVFFFIVLPLTISGCLWFFSPQIDYYAGFSGVLYGWFFWTLWPQRKDSLMRILLLLVLVWANAPLLGFALKVEEQLIGGSIISQAHLYGLIVAAALVFIRGVFSSRKIACSSRSGT